MNEENYSISLLAAAIYIDAIECAQYNERKKCWDTCERLVRRRLPPAPQTILIALSTKRVSNLQHPHNILNWLKGGGGAVRESPLEEFEIE